MEFILRLNPDVPTNGPNGPGTLGNRDLLVQRHVAIKGEGLPILLLEHAKLRDAISITATQCQFDEPSGDASITNALRRMKLLGLLGVVR